MKSFKGALLLMETANNNFLQMWLGLVGDVGQQKTVIWAQCSEGIVCKGQGP